MSNEQIETEVELVLEAFDEAVDPRQVSLGDAIAIGEILASRLRDRVSAMQLDLQAR